MGANQPAIQELKASPPFPNILTLRILYTRYAKKSALNKEAEEIKTTAASKRNHRLYQVKSSTTLVPFNANKTLICLFF